MSRKPKPQYPDCDFCNKPIKYTPLLKFENKDVMLHRTRCPVNVVAKRMQEKDYVPLGDNYVMASCSHIPLERGLRKDYTEVYWAPRWAVEFIKLTKKFNNDARHTALHTCSILKDEDKQIQFVSVVRLGGEQGLFYFIKEHNKEELCCKRGQKFMRRLERMTKKNIP